MRYFWSKVILSCLYDKEEQGLDTDIHRGKGQLEMQAETRAGVTILGMNAKD